MVLRLSSGAVPEQQGNVPQPDSFPPQNLFKYVGHGEKQI